MVHAKYVGFGEAVSRFFRNYANFGGRSTRSEYWYAQLFTILVSIALSLAASLFSKDGSSAEILSGIFSLAVLLPRLGLAVRRMHDISKSGWWLLINLIPIVGAIWYLILCCQPSHDANSYGPAPEM